MIKIAYIIDTIEKPTAGTEKQLLALINGLDKSRFECHLCCLRNSEWLDQQPSSFPVEILSIPGIARISTLSGIRRYIKYLKQNQFDIIHAHYFDSILLSAVATRFIKPVKLITSRRGFIFSEQFQKIKYTILRCLKYFYHGYISNSYSLAKFISEKEGIAPNKITVIYNGIILNNLENKENKLSINILDYALDLTFINEKELLILTIANLRSVKNIPLLIEAAGHLVNKYTDLQFVVIGEGGQRQYLEKLIEIHALTDHFHLVGTINDLVPILTRADIGVLTSTSESLSNALIEYSLAGLPVVASDVGGNREIIEDGKTGFLFESNKLEQLIEKLTVLIKNKNLRNTLGKAGREKALSRFSMDRCLKEYERYYENILL